MTFKEAQQEVDKWVGQYREGYWHPMEQIVCLTEEVGELAREVNHRYGPKKKKATEEANELGMEIADIIFILCCLANSQDIDLDDSWKRAMKKFDTRDKHRFDRA